MASIPLQRSILRDGMCAEENPKRILQSQGMDDGLVSYGEIDFAGRLAYPARAGKGPSWSAAEGDIL